MNRLLRYLPVSASETGSNDDVFAFSLSVSCLSAFFVTIKFYPFFDGHFAMILNVKSCLSL